MSGHTLAPNFRLLASLLVLAGSQLSAKFDTSNAEAWIEGDLGLVVDQPRVTLEDGRSAQMFGVVYLYDLHQASRSQIYYCSPRRHPE